MDALAGLSLGLEKGNITLALFNANRSTQLVVDETMCMYVQCVTDAVTKKQMLNLIARV